MIPILTFTRGEFGREVVMLGAEIIGEVAPHRGERARVTYALWQCGARHSFVPAASIEAARTAVADLVNDWLLRTGVFYPGQEVVVRLPDEAASARARVG